MKVFSQFNIRVSFILLLSFCVIPLSVMQFLHIHHDREESIAVLTQDINQTGLHISAQVAKLVEEARLSMTVLSHTQELMSLDTAKSTQLLSSLKPHFPNFANIGVVFDDGFISASMVPFSGKLSSSARPWYKSLVKTQEFTIDKYQIGRITNKPVILFALPLSNAKVSADSMISAIFVTVDLRYFDQILAQTSIPEGATIVITDANGTILSRFPDKEQWRGKVQPEIIGIQHDGPLVKGKGIDGKERLYKLNHVPHSNNRINVLIGYSQTQIEESSNAEMLRSLIILLIVVSVTLVIAASLAQQKLILPLLKLKAGADKIGNGDYTVRIPQNLGIREMDALGASFNSMADSLLQNIELTQVWMDTMPNPVYRKNCNGEYLACNQAFADFWGVSKVYVIGKTVDHIGDQKFAQQIQTQDEHLLKTSCVQTYEVELLRSTGETVTLLVSKAPYFGKNGLVEGIVGVFVDISERKRQEVQILKMNQNLENLVQERTAGLEVSNLKLLETQDMLELVLNSIPSRVFWKDVHSRYLGGNRLFAQDAGLSNLEDIKGKLDEDMPWGVDAAGYIEGDHKVLEGGTALIGFEEILRIPGKEAVTVLTSKIPLRNSQGDLIGVLGVYTDISARKEMEESIRTSERFLKAITSNIPGLLAYWTKDLRCAFANSGYQEWFGKSPEQMQGISMQELLGPILFAKNESHIRAALAGHPDYFERTLTKSDGSVGYTWAQYIPDIDNGEVRGFTVLVTDITGVKKAQAELAQLSTRLTLATRAGGVGVWDYDIIHNILLWDDQMYSLYGVSKDDFSGAYDAWIRGVHPEDRDRGNDEIQQAISGEKAFNTEFRVLWPNGSIHNIRAMAIVQRDDAGTAQRMIGTNWDITKQKEAEENIKQINMDLEEASMRANDMAVQAEMASAAKSEFLANMSHEIRTPMNAILGFSEILSTMITDPRQIDYLHSIRASGKTLLTLINDILDLSKIEAGRMEIQYAPVDIHSLMREIEAIFKLKCLEKNLTLSTFIAPNTPNTMLLDGTRLRQILFNLVGNAVKFTSQGGITLEVSAKNLEGLELDISVRDSGVGIRQDQLELIFQPFRQHEGQVHAVFGGTGLGLSISQRLAAMMNGSILVTSELGKGSTFTLHLTQVAVTEECAAMYFAPGSQQASTFHFSDCKVLAADDVVYNRDLMKAMLDLPGITLRVVNTGAEALNAALEESFDIILMDIRMPEMDGIETVQHLKEYPQLRDIPVVAVTASVLGDAEQKSKEAGFDGYIRKPIQRRDLLHLMVSLLGAKASETEIVTSIMVTPTEVLARKCKDTPELLSILKLEIIPACERLRSKMFISQIRELCTRVEQLAKQHQDEALESWTATLRKALDDFDTTLIGITLASFSDLLPNDESVS